MDAGARRGVVVVSPNNEKFLPRSGSFTERYLMGDRALVRRRSNSGRKSRRGAWRGVRGCGKSALMIAAGRVARKGGNEFEEHVFHILGDE
jgi:hypothetical protein